MKKYDCDFNEDTAEEIASYNFRLEVWSELWALQPDRLESASSYQKAMRLARSFLDLHGTNSFYFKQCARQKRNCFLITNRLSTVY